MSGKVFGWKKTALLACLLVWICCMAVSADGLSGDNSLSSLGIQVEGATVEPEFVYSTIEYNVTVPAGTQEIILDPVTSNPSASIVSITGQELVNGEGTVVITVQAENGSECGYYLYVTSQAAAPEPVAQPVTEKETQPPTEKETEPETEDPRYVRVDRSSLEEAEKTIETLKSETANYRDRLRLLIRILYGMIAFCVVLLFVTINLILKKKDLKAKLRDYAAYGGLPGNGGGQFPDGGEEPLQEEVPYGYEEYGGPAEGGPEPYAPEDGGDENYGQAYEEYGPDGGDGQGAFRQTGEDGPKTFGQTVEDGQGAFRQTREDGQEAFSQTGGDGSETFGQAVEDGQGAFGQTREDGQEAFGRTVGNEPETFGQTVEDGQEAFGQTAGDGQETFRETGEEAQTAGAEAKEAALHAGKDPKKPRKDSLKDDPASVPKPSKLRRKSRKMPEYREPQPAPEYQPSGRRSGKKDVEVTMIDL